MDNGLTDDYGPTPTPHLTNPGQRINHIDTPVAGSAIALEIRDTSFKEPVVEAAPEALGEGKLDLARHGKRGPKPSITENVRKKSVEITTVSFRINEDGPEVNGKIPIKKPRLEVGNNEPGAEDATVALMISGKYRDGINRKIPIKKSRLGLLGGQLRFRL